MKVKGQRNVYLGDFQSESGQGMDNDGTVGIPENNKEKQMLISSEETTSSEVVGQSVPEEMYSVSPVDEGFDSTTDHITDKVSDDISTHSEEDTQVMTAMTAKAQDDKVITVTTEDTATVTAKEPMSTKKKVAIGAVALVGAYFLMKD